MAGLGDVLQHYQGEDRRNALVCASVGPGWTLAWLPLVVVAALPAITLADRLNELALLGRPTWRAVTVALAVVLSLVAALLHRATGEARAVRLCTATALLAAASLPASVLGGRQPRLGDALVVAGTAVAGWWSVRLSDTAEVDTSLRPAPDVVRGLGALVVAMLAIVGAGEVMGAVPVPVLAAAVATMLWTVAAARLLVRWRSRSATALQAWTATFAVGMAVAEAARLVARWSLQPGWFLTSAVVRLAGLLVLTVGVVYLLTQSLEVRRSELHLLRVERVRSERDREHQQLQLQHEVRNALLGLEAATAVLRGGERLAPDRREEMTAALATGLSRLRVLLLPDGQRTAATTVPIGQIVVPTVLLARARGTQLLLDGDLDATVQCVPGALAQALDNLLVNADRHGRAREVPALVQVDRDGDRVLVRVSDRGPGVPDGLREQVFAPGVTLAATGGHGVGLPLARRLVREAGGELWVDAGLDHGACFVMSLPLAGSMDAAGAGAGEEQRDQLV
ncbi:sensor histidine kinase [Egicoccus sp. AB-alg2]|uniref:sensor histidine kinase n=1 Tax=Egicoccus sp. AB-alg2 TaxID=3242693 RepID=UPI00359DC58A